MDERLRVLIALPFGNEPEHHVSQVISILSQVPPIAPPVMAAMQAPILVVPRIFEAKLCQALIAYYNQHGGEESGFMREQDGQTIPVYDHNFKRRRDREIADEGLRKAAMLQLICLLFTLYELLYKLKWFSGV